jgi:hypothetical protein
MKITFTGEVWYWRGPSPFYFVSVPKAEGEKIKAISAGVTYGWGVIPVTVTLGESEWTTSLFPKDGTYLVPIKKVIRESAGIDVDDSVILTLEI